MFRTFSRLKLPLQGSLNLQSLQVAGYSVQKPFLSTFDDRTMESINIVKGIIIKYEEVQPFGIE